MNVQVSRLGTFNLDSFRKEDAGFKSIKTDTLEAHLKYSKTSRKKHIERNKSKVCALRDLKIFFS